jgi:taurine dioxygenase
VIHTNEFDYARTMATVDARHADTVAEYGRQFMSIQFRTRHPLVRIHPETGERALLAGGFARTIEGLDRKESASVLEVIHHHVTRLENTVRWRWEPGDVVFWDNRSTQHYAVADYGDAPRRVQRVTVGGEVPVGIDGRRSVALAGDSSAYTPRPPLVPA